MTSEEEGAGADRPRHTDEVGTFVPLETAFQGATWTRRFVVTPAIHIDETRTTPGDPVGGRGRRKSDAKWKRLGTKRYAHRSAHLNSFSRAPDLVTPTRTDPPGQPHFFKTLDQDWDLWERHRDLIFQEKGLHPADPAWDRVYALAEDLWTWRFTIQKPGGNDFSRECPWSHPTTTLLYGSWCAGCAPALMALCSTLFIPTRMVQVLDHAMTEIRLGGKWSLADNATSLVKADPESPMMTRAGLAEILLDPVNPDYGLTPPQQEKYWEKTELMYSPNTGIWGGEPQLERLDPQNALALYPGWTDPRFKSHRKDTYPLVSGRPGRGLDVLRLKQGQAFQRRFRLGSLDETKELTVWFSGAAGKATPDDDPPAHHVPKDGGDWFVAVNGTDYPVRDEGGWLFHEDAEAWKQAWPLVEAKWVHRFRIPLEDLREHDWNTVAIGSVGSGAEFLDFGGFLPWIEPAEPCWCPQVGM